MTSEIYLIDQYANNGQSTIHRATFVAKLLSCTVALLAIIFSTSPFKLLIYIAITLLLIAIAKLPLLRLIRWSLYPLIFGLMFALSQVFSSPQLALLSLIKVFATVLLMMLVITTTGFPRLFSAIPIPILRNTFLLTYRFFFMMVDSFTKKMKIMTVRGFSSASSLRKLTALSDAVAQGILTSLDKGEKVHRIMLVRGFSGKVVMHKKESFGSGDMFMLLFAAVVIVIWLV